MQPPRAEATGHMLTTAQRNAGIDELQIHQALDALKRENYPEVRRILREAVFGKEVA